MKKIILLFLVASFSFAQSIHQFENELQKQKSFLPEGYINKTLQKKISSGLQLNKTVFGYLPWWEYAAGFHQNLQYNLLSHIAIFSFEADRDGNLTNPPGWPWSDVIEAAHSNGVRVIMTVTSFDGEDIHRLMTDNGIRNKLFENIRLTLINYGLDGVNIDFENLRDKNDKMYASVAFMMNMKEYFRFNPAYEISFATPSYGLDEWNFSGLAEYSHYLFVMNYDYWGSWATTTGPSAPLTGQYISVTNSIINEYKDVPTQKIILGVPYYGNYWKTNSNQPYAEVKPFNKDSTNNNWQKILRYREVVRDYLQYEKLWDAVSNTPWIRWNDNGWNQVWYDDSTSLELKYDLAIQRNLKGIGIWALGYDGNRTELWKLIEKKFTKPTSITKSDLLPLQFNLYQNYPNPFNPSTTIEYTVPYNESGYNSIQQYVTLKVYDILGNEISIVVDDFKAPGHYTITYSPPETLPTGIYVYQLKVGKYTASKKMLYLK